jgi:hypothetical protein
MSEETTQLKAGRALDRLVAEKMGYEWLEYEAAPGHKTGRWVLPGTPISAYGSMMRHEEGGRPA